MTDEGLWWTVIPLSPGLYTYQFEVDSQVDRGTVFRVRLPAGA